jgi:hypothetical protein
MPIERYCTNTGCPGGDGCMSEYRDPSRQCVYEYVAAPKDSPEAKYNPEGVKLEADPRSRRAKPLWCG